MDSKIKCSNKDCNGLVEIDTDSFVSNIFTNDNGEVCLSTTCTGYCEVCETEHTFSNTSVATINVK